MIKYLVIKLVSLSLMRHGSCLVIILRKFSLLLAACSGVHRSLGVHHSKVRSLTLDAWEPEILKVMAELGNSVVNNIYEANIPTEVVKATPNCAE